MICTGTGTIAQFVSKKAKKSGECSRYKDAKANGAQ
jgi:hypothetical protein